MNRNFRLPIRVLARPRTVRPFRPRRVADAGHAPHPRKSGGGLRARRRPEAAVARPNRLELVYGRDVPVLRAAVEVGRAVLVRLRALLRAERRSVVDVVVVEPELGAQLLRQALVRVPPSRIAEQLL